MYRLTRLEAVNEVIQIKTGEVLATQTELDTLPQAVKASRELSMATIRMLTNAKWFFNSIENGQLTSDNDGVVTLPTSLSHITILSTDASVHVSYLRPVDGEIYDTYNHTNNIGVSKTIRYNGKMLWDFEKLPVAFQLLAIQMARLQICRNAVMSAQRLAVEKDSYNEAFQAALKFDQSLSGGRAVGVSLNRKQPPYNKGFV